MWVILRVKGDAFFCFGAGGGGVRGVPPFFLGWWGCWVLFGLGVGPGLPGWPG